MTCGSCGAENDSKHRFCSQCGSPLEVGCPSCGAANEPAARYCGSCGTALGAEAAAPGRSAESIPFIDEARTILADLGAKPLLARAEQALAGRPASAA